MRLSIDAVHTSTDILAFMFIWEIQETIQRNVHLQQLKEYIVRWWLKNRHKFHKTYDPFGHLEMTLQ